MIIGMSIAVTIVALMAMAVKMQRAVNAKGGCPDCATPVPLYRRPTSVRQALWGGWTCDRCGTEMDRLGDRLAKA